MALQIGTMVSMMLRDGSWIRSASVLNVTNTSGKPVVTLTLSNGAQQTLDMHKDVALVTSSSLISL